MKVLRVTVWVDFENHGQMEIVTLDDDGMAKWPVRIVFSDSTQMSEAAEKMRSAAADMLREEQARAAEARG